MPAHSVTSSRHQEPATPTMNMKLGKRDEKVCASATSAATSTATTQPPTTTITATASSITPLAPPLPHLLLHILLHLPSIRSGGAGAH